MMNVQAVSRGGGGIRAGASARWRSPARLRRITANSSDSGPGPVRYPDFPIYIGFKRGSGEPVCFHSAQENGECKNRTPRRLEISDLKMVLAAAEESAATVSAATAAEQDDEPDTIKAATAAAVSAATVIMFKTSAVTTATAAEDQDQENNIASAPSCCTSTSTITSTVCCRYITHVNSSIKYV